jgi:hypothetical protein
MDAVRKQAADVVATDRIAGLVGSFVNLKTLAAPLEHLRHERQALKAPALVECSENLVLAPDFDPITRTQLHEKFSLFLSTGEY